MKWFPFAILALVFLLCQTTLAPYLRIGTIQPEWTFVLVVHYALWGVWPDAAIAAWLLGLGVDLWSDDPAGLHAFCYGAAAWGILRVRHVMFREHPITHVVVTFLFLFGIQLIVMLVRGWKLGTLGTDHLLWTAVVASACTAVWAPLFHWPLQRVRRWTGLGSQRRRSLFR